MKWHTSAAELPVWHERLSDDGKVIDRRGRFWIEGHLVCEDVAIESASEDFGNHAFHARATVPIDVLTGRVNLCPGIMHPAWFRLEANDGRAFGVHFLTRTSIIEPGEGVMIMDVSGRTEA